MRTSLQQFTVATAGLELLAGTRLKVACQLLMADLLQIQVVPWQGQSVDLLVADSASAAGGEAIRASWQARVLVISITREAQSGNDAELLPTATVREIAESIKQRLIAGGTDQAAQPPRSLRLLDYLRLDKPRDASNSGRMLMELGLFRVVVDPLIGRLHMLRRMPLDELLDRVDDLRWQSSVLSLDDWLRLYQPDVTVSYSIELLWWHLAARETVELPVVPLGDTRLASWPDMDIGQTPASWLPALAQLRVRAWPATALAEASGLPAAVVRRIMTAVHLSGLAQAGLVEIDTAARRPKRMAEQETRSFMRIARRFGLKLLGMQRG